MAVALLAGCTHAPWKPYDGWRAVKTKHITMYTDTRFVHQRALEPLETAYATLKASLFAQVDLGGPIEVLFVEDSMHLALLGRFRQGATIARLPGEGRLGARGLVVATENLVYVAQNGTAPRASHLLAHVFLNALAPKAPLWAHEGYANFLWTAQYRSGDKNAIACLGHLGPESPMIPLGDLFSWNWIAVDESQKAAWYGFTGGALLNYFIVGQGGANRSQFANLMARMSRGQPSLQALSEALPGVSLDQLSKSVIDHRRASELRPRGICPMDFPIGPAGMADRSEGQFEPVASDDIHRLIDRVRMLPRRSGYVDWYPPESITLAGAQVK